MKKTTLERAVTMLDKGYTCVICDDNRVMTSTRRGIAPLLERYERGERLTGAAIADRIVGKAAAMLAVLMGASAVYGGVMSEAAWAVLTEAGIEARCGERVDGIVNRDGDGPCPMERAVAELTDPADAPTVLRRALDALAN